MHEEAHRSVVQVSDARGFVFQGEQDDQRYLVTASHCLPRLPRAPSDASECTYPDLLGPLGRERRVWAECLFVDPVADIAVLGGPDNQEFVHQAKAYEELVNEAEPLSMRLCQDEEEGWLFALDAKHWFRCTVYCPQTLWIANAAEAIRGGMSGSPILAADGTAIAVCCTSRGTEDEETHTEGGPNPGYLNRPGWLLNEFAAHSTLGQLAKGGASQP
jgi:hypothetical protein